MARHSRRTEHPGNRGGRTEGVPLHFARKRELMQTCTRTYWSSPEPSRFIPLARFVSRDRFGSTRALPHDAKRVFGVRERYRWEF